MRYLPLAGLAAAVVFTGAPAFAQTVDELIVQGHGRTGAAQSLSETVSYADLNLRQPADRLELRHRVVLAAKDVCRRLGEDPPIRGNLGKSCQDVALRDAMSQVRVAVADAGTYPEFAANYVVPASAMDADYSAPVSATEPMITTNVVTNGPIPDTAANRAKYGGPNSRAGKVSRPRGN